MNKPKPYHRISILSKNYWSLDLRSEPVHIGFDSLADDAVSHSLGYPLSNDLRKLSTFHISLPKPEKPFTEMGQIDLPVTPATRRIFKELLLTTCFNGIRYSQQITDYTDAFKCERKRKKRSAWAKVDKEIMVDILAGLKPNHEHNWWSWDGHEDWYPHVSLANLTGSPYDSIKHPQKHVLKSPWFDNDTTDEEKGMLEEDYNIIHKGMPDVWR